MFDMSWLRVDKSSYVCFIFDHQKKNVGVQEWEATWENWEAPQK